MDKKKKKFASVALSIFAVIVFIFFNAEEDTTEYHFKNDDRLSDHYYKHGIEMGFASEEEYEERASEIINDPSALHKTEKEDEDDIYYLEETNEIVFVSDDGYIRTYFNPEDGIEYYEEQ